MNKFRFLFPILAVVWALLLAAAPLAAGAAGAAGPASAAHALAFVVYGIGSLICHQRPERSFFLFGAQLPVCARCTGIYAAAALFAFVSWASPSLAAAAPVRVLRSWRRDPRTGRLAAGVDGARLALLMAALPTAATLVYEWTTGRIPGSWIRAAAGAPLGALVAWMVSGALGARDLQPRRVPGTPGPSCAGDRGIGDHSDPIGEAGPPGVRGSDSP